MDPKLEQNRNNVVLTGLARSGTTLACRLLNELPNTVALVEPISPNKYAHLPSHEAMSEGIERYFKNQRRMALRKGRVTTKHVGGVVPDNTYASAPSEAGPRSKVSSKGDIPVGKELDRDFTLVIKQPGLFTALLPALNERFPCYALIRNPLSVLASGSTIRTFGTKSRTQRRKHPPTMPRFNKDLAIALAERKGNRLERRLYLLSWQFERFGEVLPEGHVIRYEDIVASKGRALSVITPAAQELDEPLKSKNLNELYDRDQMLKYGEALLESDGAYWDFYPREEIEDLLSQLG